MRRKKSKKFLVRRVVALLLLLIFGLIIRNVISDFWSQNQLKQTRLLYNNEMLQLTNELQIENEVIYVSEEDIKNIFDDTIYYNVGDKELITTHNKHVAVLHLDEAQMIVNDSNLEMQGKLKEIDGKIYLPISDLGIVYDIEVEYAKDTNMVIMDSTLKAKSRVMTLKDAKVKTGKGIFARTLEKVKVGDFLYVLKDERRYLKVRTNSGNIGYIKSKKVSNIEVLREDWIEENIVESDFENSSEMFTINQGNIGITNISTSLTTYLQRNQVINKIYADMMQSGKRVLCIDFQNVDDRNCFYRFVIELTPKFKESGMKVCVKLTPQIEEEKIKNIVDFILK